MTTFEFGDIVLVPFPFTDQRTTKKRPAVVVSSNAYNAERPDLLLLAITSQLRRETRIGDRAIAGWREAGLLKPSVFKPLITTVERVIVIKVLGKLQLADRRAAAFCQTPAASAARADLYDDSASGFGRRDDTIAGRRYRDVALKRSRVPRANPGSPRPKGPSSSFWGLS